jgi:hypothetical protein
MRLMETESKNEQEFLDGVLGVINTISHDEHESVFEEWLLPLGECVQRITDYVE